MITEIAEIGACAEDNEKKLLRAADIIKRGGLVVFPTETVYGLGADATNAEAAERIYAAKGRPSDNPLIIHISSPEDAEKYTYVSDTYKRLAERFMPGPLTVIMPSKDIIPKKTRAGLDTVALRCPSNPIARRLIELSGVPIAAPSANLSGSPSPTTPRHVMDDMQGRVDMIIDGGDCDFGLESTIVKIEQDGSLLLLRPGKITPEQLSRIAPVAVADAVTDKLAEGERVLSPGMKYRHYAPRASLILLDAERGRQAEYIREQQGRVALLSYSENIDYFNEKLPELFIYDLGGESDEKAQAHRLFAILREADKENFDTIFAPLPQKEGIGLALYNRMIRAAAHKIVKL